MTAWYDYDVMGRRSRAYYLNDRNCEGTYEEEPSPFDPPDEYDPSTWREPDDMPAGASDWVPGQDTASISYSYDDAGNLKTIVNHIWAPGAFELPNKTTWAYSYDAKNRLLISAANSS